MKAARWLALIAAAVVVVAITFNNIHKAKSDEVAPAPPATTTVPDPGYRLTINFVDPEDGPLTLVYGDPEGPIFKTMNECNIFKDSDDTHYRSILDRLAMQFVVHHVNPKTVHVACVSRNDLDPAHGGVKSGA